MYEILQAVKLTIGEDAYQEKKNAYTTTEGRKWKEFLEGLEFEMDVKIGDRKDGSGKFMIVGTKKQKAKDKAQAEEYKKNQAETTTNKIDQDDLPF